MPVLPDERLIGRFVTTAKDATGRRGLGERPTGSLQRLVVPSHTLDDHGAEVHRGALHHAFG